MIRFGLEFGYFKPPCGSGIPDVRPQFVRHFVDDIHYLHYGAILFLITGVVTVIISLAGVNILPNVRIWGALNKVCNF